MAAHHAPGGRVPHRRAQGGRRDRTAEQQILHQRPGQRGTGSIAVISRAALPGVQFKQHRLAAAVVFQIKIGKAAPARRLQKAAQSLQQGGVLPGGFHQHSGVVANALGCTLLQKGLSLHKPRHTAVGGAVGVHDPQPRIRAGDVLLQKHGPAVAAAGGCGQNLLQFGGIPGQIDLALAREMAVPPGGRVSRLNDDRPAEGQLEHNVPRVYCYALRRAQAHGAAGGGKLLFIGQGQRGGWRAGKAVRPPQFGGTAGHKLGVAVGAGDEQPRSAGVLLGQAQQRGGENAVPLKRWVLGGHLHNTAVGQRRQRTAADGQAAHAVCLIKAAGHTVDIGIPAQQHRQYLRHRNSPLPLVYAARGRLFFLPSPIGRRWPRRAG